MTRPSRSAVRAALVLAIALAVWANHRAAAVVTPLAPADAQLAEILSGIDYVPDRVALDDALGAAAPDVLIAIGRGDDPTFTDVGARIRAYRALALYPGPDTVSALRAVVSTHGASSSGMDTVFVRAAAASALAVTGAESALVPLRTRRTVEQLAQVQIAIDDALRALGETTEATNLDR